MVSFDDAPRALGIPGYIYFFTALVDKLQDVEHLAMDVPQAEAGAADLFTPLHQALQKIIGNNPLDFNDLLALAALRSMPAGSLVPALSIDEKSAACLTQIATLEDHEALGQINEYIRMLHHLSTDLPRIEAQLIRVVHCETVNVPQPTDFTKKNIG